MDAIDIFMKYYIIFLCLSICHRIECITINVRCNFNKFQSGCADRVGSLCDKKECICKPDFTIRLGEYCLQPKYMGEDCFVTQQCNHIPNSGCYNYREEFNQNPSNFFGSLQKMWPSGVCRCKIGHRFESNLNTCVKRVVGSWCSNAWDCPLDKKLSVNVYECDNNECKCSANHIYNQTTYDCYYRETYGKPCVGRDDCNHPTICSNSTCDCAANYHYDSDKTPNCQQNNNLNDISRSAGSLDETKGDKTFEIFLLTVIPIAIIFLTLKPCLNKFGKCKPRTDEVICGSKEISINCNNLDKQLVLNQHKFNEKLQTIEEMGEEIKSKDDEMIASQVDISRKDELMSDDKSIDNESPKDNRLPETTISIDSSTKS